MTAAPKLLDPVGGRPLFVETSRTLPLVSFAIGFETGSYFDPVGKEGLMRFVGRLLRRGTKRLDAKALEATIDRLGAELSVEVSHANVTVHGQVIRRNLEPFVALVAEVLGEPAFDAEELERLRKKVLAERIEALVGPLLRPAAVVGDAPRPAPGMVDRHYAPRARLQPFAAFERPAVWQQLAALAAAGCKVGLLAFATDGARATEVRCMPGDAAGYARELYAALHALDAAGCELAYVEQLPVDREWEAVADRLRRAGLPRS